MTKDTAQSRRVGTDGVFTLTLQKSRMPQIQGVKGEAVVIYAEPLTTQEMRYPRLSPKGKQHGCFSNFLDVTRSEFHNIARKKTAKNGYCCFSEPFATLFMQH